MTDDELGLRRAIIEAAKRMEELGAAPSVVYAFGHRFTWDGERYVDDGAVTTEDDA